MVRGWAMWWKAKEKQPKAGRHREYITAQNIFRSLRRHKRSKKARNTQALIATSGNPPSTNSHTQATSLSSPPLHYFHICPSSLTLCVLSQISPSRARSAETIQKHSRLPSIVLSSSYDRSESTDNQSSAHASESINPGRKQQNRE